MKRTLKVYGWRGWRQECRPMPNGGHQTREIVAAPSIAAAFRAIGDKWHQPTRSEIVDTGNAQEIAQAMSAPGVVFWKPLDDRSNTWTAVGSAPLGPTPQSPA